MADDDRKHRPAQRAAPIPRDMPDQQVRPGRADPWDAAPIRDADAGGDDVPDTDEAGTGRRTTAAASAPGPATGGSGDRIAGGPAGVGPRPPAAGDRQPGGGDVPSGGGAGAGPADDRAGPLEHPSPDESSA